MHHSGNSLDRFFHEYVRRGEPLVLATVVQTIGSTYRKSGAQMFIGGDGRTAGLLSGGCLESDLTERALAVLESGRATLVDYDSRGSDDLIWGLGLGCEGTMRILLTKLDAPGGYEPYAFQTRCRRDDRAGRIALAVQAANPNLPLGTVFRSDDCERAPVGIQAALAIDGIAAKSERTEPVEIDADGAKFLLIPVILPVHLLILGAGPDAIPLAQIAAMLDWSVTVLDHRAAYAMRERFPHAHRVDSKPAASLSLELQVARYDAAVVMSHHLPSDQAYLAALADSTIPYIGLLGPAPRRLRLMHEIGNQAAALQGRLYGPVGLDIGAFTPESIALAIVAEILAVRSKRSGQSFSTTVEG